jgi:hypothetical protein
MRPIVARVKRVLAALAGLYLLAALVGRLLESVGVARCGCSAGCWCRRPGLSAFRWVAPVGHR